ncbi:MAG: FG-GAP-like repeat-containing protein [Planctomycetales bacterium]
MSARHETDSPSRWTSRARIAVLGGVSAIFLGGLAIWKGMQPAPSPTTSGVSRAPVEVTWQPRSPVDSAGFIKLASIIEPWDPNASLEAIAEIWKEAPRRTLAAIDQHLTHATPSDQDRISLLLTRASLLNYQGNPRAAYDGLQALRESLEGQPALAERWLATVVYFQGVTALRRGETENCIQCRGESSCIFPIDSRAVHQYPKGSQLAIRHFREYLQRFPDDLEVRWLLNVAHMTLGEYPHALTADELLELEQFTRPTAEVAPWRDVGHLVRVNRYNQAGGAILEDFDNDGLLDIVTTSMDPREHMAYFRNAGDGTFADQTREAGLEAQLGGLYCVQTDYNNDGFMDIFVPRGAWLQHAIRPSLLRNERHGTFSDVTLEAGLLDPVNSISGAWADYDNDGWLDLFVCCERQASRLYRNLGNGSFEEVARDVGLQVEGEEDCKGAAWIDFDNDGFQDLFLNYLTPQGGARLYRNLRNGRFADVTQSLGIDGPTWGFSCWAFDYDNDGWLDLFASCYERTLKDAVLGLQGKPATSQTSRLYRNQQGKRFQDVTSQTGLDGVYVTMGSNFADFNNDGWLDMYLGTGDPGLATLVPNRMLWNQQGERFSDVTAPSRTGHLQKGHGVACGDWDRDGDVDLFIEMGGAIPGDMYHNVLFQNPGGKHHSLTVKLIGQQSNRAAIGARLRVVTDEDRPRTICRHISSGSSFGANPLQQTIGLGPAQRIRLLEVHWPTSGTTQRFQDLAADQAIEITEFADEYRALDRPPLPLPPDP